MQQEQAFLQKFDYNAENLSGKNALVTGGTTGIGRATALLLAAQGAQVMVFGRDEQALQDTLNDFKSVGLEENVHGLNVDIAFEQGVEKVFQEVDRHFGGRLDILINNAALPYQSIQDGAYKDWQYVLNTNVLAYLACSREAIDRMKKHGSGHIVNIGSMSAEVREKNSSVYVATKGAVEAFSTALRKEVNADGIKVTLIEPGAVGTDMSIENPEEEREKQEKLEVMKAEDIAVCVLFTLIQPKRCDVIEVKIRPHLQLI